MRFSFVTSHWKRIAGGIGTFIDPVTLTFDLLISNEIWSRPGLVMYIIHCLVLWSFQWFLSHTHTYIHTYMHTHTYNAANHPTHVVNYTSAWVTTASDQAAKTVRYIGHNVTTLGYGTYYYSALSSCYVERSANCRRDVRLSLCLSVTHTGIVKSSKRPKITRSSLTYSPRTVVCAKTSKRLTPSDGVFVSGVGKWRFSANKSPYLRNIAIQKEGCCWSRRKLHSLRAFEWYRNRRPWMTLNIHCAVIMQ